MNEEEIKALMGNVDKAIAEALTKSNGESTKEIEALKLQLTALTEKMDADKENDKSEEISKEVIRLAGEVKALNEKGTEDKEGFATIKEALHAALTEKGDELKAVVDNDGVMKAPIYITVKAVAPISVTSTIAAGSTQNTITQDTGIISTIRKREMTYLSAVSVGNISTNRAVWIEETDEEGVPVMLAEGDSKTQLDVQYVEQTTSVKKIAVYGKVTTELMADIPQLVSHIQNNILKRMDIVLEDQYFSGDGAGNNLKGMDEYAVAFSAGALAAAVDDANELDVFEAIALQVKLAFGEAVAVFIHPSTMATIKLIKDTAGRPVWKDYVTTNGMMNVSGLDIIETTAVAADSFLGGDTKVMQVLKRSELSMQIGLDGNDFTKNLKTMLVEKRVAQFASANDVNGLITGTFTAAKAALETV